MMSKRTAEWWIVALLVVTLIFSASVPGAAAWFADVTAEVGLSGDWAVFWGDYNGDGWVDVCMGGVLFRNNNGQSFTMIEEIEGYLLGRLRQRWRPGSIHSIFRGVYKVQ